MCPVVWQTRGVVCAKREPKLGCGIDECRSFRRPRILTGYERRLPRELGVAAVAGSLCKLAALLKRELGWVVDQKTTGPSDNHGATYAGSGEREGQEQMLLICSLTTRARLLVEMAKFLRGGERLHEQKLFQHAATCLERAAAELGYVLPTFDDEINRAWIDVYHIEAAIATARSG